MMSKQALIKKSHQLLTNCQLEQSKLRETFVIYACLSDSLIEDISLDKIYYDIKDIRNKLFPVLQQKKLSRQRTHIEEWASSMLADLKRNLTILLPLRQYEIDFIRLIREKGEIKPDLITANKNLIEAVKIHPLIRWKAINSNKNLAK